MKATEQYFPVVLFIMLYTVLNKIMSLKMNFYSVNIQMKATVQYFPVTAIFIMKF